MAQYVSNVEQGMSMENARDWFQCYSVDLLWDLPWEQAMFVSSVIHAYHLRHEGCQGLQMTLAGIR